MSDNRPTTLTVSPEALFRGRVIALVVLRLAVTGRVSDAVRLVAATSIPTLVPGQFRVVSERTIWRWWKIYHQANGRIEALEPKRRHKSTSSQVLSDDLVDFFVDEKLLDPNASIPELIRKAKEVGTIHVEATVDRTTVWRALQRRHVVTGRNLTAVIRDSRRFCYEHRMQMVLADFKHFRAGPTGCKRLALYFIDDATRYVLGVLVTSGGEAVEDVLKLFHLVVLQYGRMSMLFLDNGSGFKAKVLEQVALNFDPSIAVVLGTAGYPEGHGKVERFNRAVKARVLRHLRKPGIDPDPGALTVRLQHDVDFYNTHRHEGINAKPKDRWDSDTRALQPVKGDDDLERIFTVSLKNKSKVTADHIISVHGVKYELPRGYARQKVQVYRRVLQATKATDALYIDHKGAMLRLHPVDIHHNARSKRAVAPTKQAPTRSPNTQSAAELAFKRELGPITNADGGYSDKEPQI